MIRKYFALVTQPSLDFLGNRKQISFYAFTIFNISLSCKREDTLILEEPPSKKDCFHLGLDKDSPGYFSLKSSCFHSASIVPQC